jgi:sarcosine oxidase subunit gamma
VCAADGVRLNTCAAQITEIGAARGRTPDLVARLRAHGLELPGIGRLTMAAERLLLCVRPERWLVIASPESPGADAASIAWRQGGDAVSGAVDLSAAHAGLLLQGARSAEVLARGCRLDLDRHAFPPGSAAATIIAQTQVYMAALPIGMLLLAPSSLARHFRNWLAGAASPFGLMPQSTISVANLCRNSET